MNIRDRLITPRLGGWGKLKTNIPLASVSSEAHGPGADGALPTDSKGAELLWSPNSISSVLPS